MNSLNLRVATIKTAENVRKNAEARTSIVRLPVTFKGANQILETFNNASTIPEQISVIQNLKVSKKYSNDDKMHFLVELYFHCPLKHPVRNQCSKLIKGNPDIQLVTINLDSAIVDLIEIDIDNCMCEEINFFVTSISGCFENFAIAKETLRPHAKKAVQFLYNTIQKYLKYLSTVNSPSVKNEFYVFIHNSVRVILSCIQEFSKEFSFNDSESILNPLKEMGFGIIEDVLMPMDIKTNIGILLGYLAQILNKYEDWLIDIINFYSVYHEKYLNDCYQLCACIGVINTLKAFEVEIILDKICSIVEKVCFIGSQYSTEPNMLLAATRSLYQFSKLLCNNNLANRANDVYGSTELLFDYTFSYLDHHMDSIRHITKDMLRNILNICSIYEKYEIIDKIYKYIMEDEASLSIKCILISNIAKVFGTKEMIQLRYDNIFEDLFTSENFVKDINVGNCFESLMTTSYKEIDLDRWQTIYIDFLINKINSAEEEDKIIYENLLNKCVKFAPQITNYLLENKSKNIDLNIRLSVLCALRKNGLRSENYDVLTQNISDLNKAFLSISDETRISSLRLLAESHKSTEELTELECKNFIFFLNYNMNCQDPAIRQKILGLSIKIIARLDVNLKKIIKDGKHENEFRNLHFYFKCLKDLIELLFNNLFEGANFSRRYVSLELLKKILEIVKSNGLNFTNFLPANSLNKIFSILNDTYEINKNNAIDILKFLIDANIGQLIVNKTTCMNLIVSVKPSDSITASYYLEFYCYSFNLKTFIEVFHLKNDFPVPQYKPIEFCALKMVLNILKSGLTTATVSILLAAISNPLYGCLLNIRHILSKLNFNLLAQEETWRTLINEIIKVNKNASKIVGPIVNSSSPEGYLPNDFNEYPKAYIENLIIELKKQFPDLITIQNISLENLQPTPQMVLICAWRTIKEVSLILGELSLRSPIKCLQSDSKDKNFLLTTQHILEIGDHFKLLLSETKHRGAFEQAYVGFTKLCSRLWRVDQNELNELPIKWLVELIDLISNDEKVNEKICATRRSAGFPFMVQALITSELQMGTTKALKLCMNNLFKICNSNEHSTESKTHCLNILRTLFRCTDLNEVCSEYIADGIICAIQGYNGETWSERNSSTLLFAALITRIFGVQITKDTDNINIRNKMTGRIFFARYPKLFDFILNELKEAKRLIENNEKSNKLQPLLLIMSRLYPSALEGTESHLKLSMFVSVISPCSASRDIQTRILVAKAIVAFIPLDLMEQRIFTILSLIKIQLSEGKGLGLNSNYLHGLLLQILYLVISLKQKSPTLIEDIINDLLYYECNLKLNVVIMRTIFHIFYEILKAKNNICARVIKQLSVLEKSPVYKNPEYSKFYTIFRKSFCIFKYQISMLNMLNTSVKEYWEQQWSSNDKNNFLCSKYEELETHINIILLILFSQTAEFEYIIDEFECSKHEKGFVKMILPEFKEKSVEFFKSSTVLESIVREILNLSENNSIKVKPEITAKAFAILSHLNILEEFKLIQLIDYSKIHSNNLQSSIALLINNYLERKPVNIKEYEVDIVEYLQKISQPWNSFTVRFMSSMIINHFYEHFIISVEQKNEYFISEFSSIILCLLMDDDVDIRHNTSKIAISFCPDYAAKYDNAISTFTQRIFIERLTEFLSKSSKNDKKYARKVLNNIIDIMQRENKTNVNEMNDSEIFDKNEVNIYAEFQKVFLDCAELFEEKFREKL